MKRIVVNATQREELRVAIVDGQILLNLDIEPTSLQYKKGDIYKAVVTSVAPSLNAVFVNYGSDRHGFLPFRDITSEYIPADRLKGRNRSVKNSIKVGDELPVQIVREERGEKGALLTTYISLVNCYLVFMPYSSRVRSISQRIEGDERERTQKMVANLKNTNNAGIIVRTSGAGHSIDELQADLNYLNNLWEAIQNALHQSEPTALLHQESNIVIQVVRDYLNDNIEKVIIDNRETYEEVCKFVNKMLPNAIHKIELYEGSTPLFSDIQIERQIENVFKRKVNLPSGGSVVIDHTEALTSIDINSAHAVKGNDIEETALVTNLEAADEIGRQLRLRDLGGLIVIDFIDMMPIRNKRRVEEQLAQVIKSDRARVQIGRISSFGLLEMSRQRLRPSLGDTNRTECPRCSGYGFIRTYESCSLAVIRLIEEEATKSTVSNVKVEVPTEISSFLLNKKRKILDDIESSSGSAIQIIPDTNMETPNYKITGQRSDGIVINTIAPLSENDESNTSTVSKPSAHRQDTKPVVDIFSIANPKTSMFWVRWIERLLRLFKPKKRHPSKYRGKRRNDRRGRYRQSNNRNRKYARSNTKNQRSRNENQQSRNENQEEKSIENKPTNKGQRPRRASSNRKLRGRNNSRNQTRNSSQSNNKDNDNIGNQANYNRNNNNQKRSASDSSRNKSNTSNKKRLNNRTNVDDYQMPQAQDHRDEVPLIEQVQPDKVLPEVKVKIVAKAPVSDKKLSSGLSNMVQVETKKSTD